jgi:hypothetical protein
MADYRAMLRMCLCLKMNGADNHVTFRKRSDRLLPGVIVTKRASYNHNYLRNLVMYCNTAQILFRSFLLRGNNLANDDCYGKIVVTLSQFLLNTPVVGC